MMLSEEDAEFVAKMKKEAEDSPFVGGCFGGGNWLNLFTPPEVLKLIAIIEGEHE